MLIYRKKYKNIHKKDFDLAPKNRSKLKKKKCEILIMYKISNYVAQ